APRFHKAALAAGMKPIIGAELTVASQGPGGSGKSGGSGREGFTDQAHPAYQPHPTTWTLPVLCESQDGYRNLCRLITRMKLRAPKGEGALTIEDLDGSTRGLVALVGRAALDGRRYGVGGLLDRAIGIFGRDAVFVELHR